MGLNNAFMSLGRIAGPTWAGFAFDRSIDVPYLSGAIIMFIGFLLTLPWLRPESSPPLPAARSASEPEVLP
jgi:DHA1 family multidrug resistance protein-like MFS transporter